ncbi:amidohydrolase [Flavobacteriaceae bacterium]|nr:amidohydrolase [Flavobacteriaceae bacterium]
MKNLEKIIFVFLTHICSIIALAQTPIVSEMISLDQQELKPIKDDLQASIENQKKNLISISDAIWEAAETSLEEYTSSKLLMDYARANGFQITENIADIPTAFMATYGSGKPVIGILGEFDANAGISQKLKPTKEARVAGGAGHGCGHNLFGTASLAAAVAIKEQIEKGTFKGTVIFYGTPAEETIFAKVWMVREGVFDQLDICMDWHPGDTNQSGTETSKALVDFRVMFYGDSSHASSDPWNGNSAVDAMELYTTGLNYYREHILPTSRIHYQIEAAGDVVNVVPDYAKIWTRLRGNTVENVNVLYDRALDIAKAASLMTGTRYETKLISGIYEVLVNRIGAEIMQNNMEALGEITYTEDELLYANTILKETGKPQVGIDGSVVPLQPTLPASGGSTDVGDVSQVVPTVRMSATVASKGGPWHSWAVVACTGMSIGHKGMIYAAKALSMTMADFYKNPKMVEAVKEDFNKNRTIKEYVPRILPGPPSLD